MFFQSLLTYQQSDYMWWFHISLKDILRLDIRHNTKVLDFRISDMILQGSRYDPLKAGEMAFKLALIYITVPIRVALQTPFTVSVSKTGRPFSYNLKVFLDKSVKILRNPAIHDDFRNYRRSPIRPEQTHMDSWLKNSLRIMKKWRRVLLITTVALPNVNPLFLSVVTWHQRRFLRYLQTVSTAQTYAWHKIILKMH